MAIQTYTSEFTSQLGTRYKTVISYDDPAEATSHNTDTPLVSATIERKELNENSSILSSSLNLTILSPDDRTFVPLMSLDYTKVDCKVYQYVNSAWQLFWFGYLDPEGYSEPYERLDNYEASFTFSDFGLFKNITVENAQKLLNNTIYDMFINEGKYPFDFFMKALRPTDLDLASNIQYNSTPVYKVVNDYQSNPQNIVLFVPKSFQASSSITDIQSYDTHIPYSKVDRQGSLYEELEKILYAVRVFLYQDNNGRLALKSYQDLQTETPTQITWKSDSQTLEISERYESVTIELDSSTQDSNSEKGLIDEDAVEQLGTTTHALNTSGIYFTNAGVIDPLPSILKERIFYKPYELTTTSTSPLYSHWLYSRPRLNAIYEDATRYKVYPYKLYRNGWRTKSSAFSLLCCRPEQSPLLAQSAGAPGVQPGTGATLFHVVKQLGNIDDKEEGFICSWTFDAGPMHHYSSKNITVFNKLDTNRVGGGSYGVFYDGLSSVVYKTEPIVSPTISAGDTSMNYELLISSKLLFDYRITPGVDLPFDNLVGLNTNSAMRSEKEWLNIYRNTVRTILQPVKITATINGQNYYYINVATSYARILVPNRQALSGLEDMTLSLSRASGIWVRDLGEDNVRRHTFLTYYNEQSITGTGHPIGENFVSNLQSITTYTKNVNNLIKDNAGEHITLPWYNTATGNTNCYVYDNGALVKDTQSSSIESYSMTFNVEVYTRGFEMYNYGGDQEKSRQLANKSADVLITIPTVTIQRSIDFSTIDASLDGKEYMKTRVTDDTLFCSDTTTLKVSYAPGSVTASYLYAMSRQTTNYVGNVESLLYTHSSTDYWLSGVNYFAAMTLSQFRKNNIILKGVCLPSSPLGVYTDAAYQGSNYKKFYKSMTTLDLVEGTEDAEFTELAPIEYLPE